jgi:predicted ATPase
MIANRYRIDSEIGKGGMGTVYKGLDTQTGQVVAIKHLMPQVANRDLIERFKREGEALRELNHPNIVMMLDAIAENGDYYLIIEYLSGGDLNDLIQETKLPIKQVLQIAIDISDALTRAHRLNIIHRDLKPANILLADDGTPRLTDFGIAHIGTKERVTKTDMIVGTVDYLAPEVLNGESNDPRSDIWAFGVMLYEMLTGVRPFTAPTVGQTINHILNDSAPDLEVLRPDIPVALVDTIYRMLEKDPHARVSSVRYIGAMLEDILSGRDTDSITIALDDHKRFATPTPEAILRSMHNLPAQVTAFVGREAELAEVVRLVNDVSIRLVTIVAQGGMGKTRLGLEVAAQYVSLPQPLPNALGRDFNDGVYFVELAPLSDVASIIPAIAEATGYLMQTDGRDEKQQILDYLSKKNLLLVLDNYEHLLDGAGLVTDILKAAPRVKVLATSRQRLNQSGETVFNLHGMDFPQWETPADALEYAAVKLFMQSARRAQPQFEVTHDNMSYIARICRLVQGLPLGIVLAASWLSVLQPEEIASEIGKSVDFLESDMGDLPERHRSIRAVFDYSWNLMTEAEQQTFSALSIFRGGFTREAAEAVASANLRTLMTLVNKSVIRRNADTGRYDIHELLRQYAEEMLVEDGQVENVKDKYADYIARFVEQNAVAIKGQAQLKGLNAVEVDFENIQAAWNHAVKACHATNIQRMIEGVHLFCLFRSRLVEGQRMFAEARKQWSDDAQPELIVGQLMVRLTKTRDQALYERGLEIARLHHDKKEIAFCMEQLGVVLAHQLVDAKGITLLEQSRDLYQELGEQFYVAQTLDELGWGYGLNQQIQRRIPTIDECIKIRKAIGDQIGTANALRNLATAEWLILGHAGRDIELLLESRQILYEVRDRASLAWSVLILGAIYMVRARWDEAESSLAEGEMLANDIQVPVLMALAIILRGMQKAMVFGEYEEALRLVDSGLQLDNPDDPDFALISFVTQTRALCYVGLGNEEKVFELQTRSDSFYHSTVMNFQALAVSWFAPIYAKVLEARGRYKEAIEKLSMVFNHPNTDALWVKEWQPAIRMQEQVRQKLGDTAYEAAWEAGKQLSYEEFRNQILAEFET